ARRRAREFSLSMAVTTNSMRATSCFVGILTRQSRLQHRAQLSPHFGLPCLLAGATVMDALGIAAQDEIAVAERTGIDEGAAPRRHRAADIGGEALVVVQRPGFERSL